MQRYTLNFNKKKSAKAYGRALRISTKKAQYVCKYINRKKLLNAENILEDVVNGKRRLDRKVYFKASKIILELLRSAKKNAEFKGLDLRKLIVFASAHKGFTYYTPKSTQRRGRRVNTTNVQIVLRMG